MLRVETYSIVTPSPAIYATQTYGHRTPISHQVLASS